MYTARSRLGSIWRHFSSATKPKRIPSHYKSMAIDQAQKAITDYLFTTRSLSYTYAEYIAKNAAISTRKLMLKLNFSAPTYAKSLQKHLRYHPLNELEFFFESIGIEYNELDEYLPPKKFFFSEERSALDAACALSGFGFPWTKLGKLYKEESSIFRQSPKEITSRLLNMKDRGFGSIAVIGICLAFPRVLCVGNDSTEESRFFDNLKRLCKEFDTDSSVEENVDSWLTICRKIKVFYTLGSNNEEVWQLIGRNKSLFMEYPEEVLIQKADYFCRFGVKKVDVALLILKSPEILNYDLETPEISVTGILKHFGFSQDELEAIANKYRYVLGRNKMKNFPHVTRALDLHERVFDILKNGKHHLLAEYSLNDPLEDIVEEYEEKVEEIRNTITAKHTCLKLDFLHAMGFGRNALTLVVLKYSHGTSTELQDRFQILLDNRIKFSRVCMFIRVAPKLLTQTPQSIEAKLRFLCDEMKLSLDYLDGFPAFLCFSLECRIKPRFRFHKWLKEKGFCNQNYSLSGVVATSEKAFISRIYGLHPAIPKHWFEQFSYKRPRNLW